MAGERPVRPCLLCGKYDDGPRDQAWLPDGNTVFYHMDCHAMVGCETCKAVIETTGGSLESGDYKKNDDLVAHLTDPQVLAAHEIFTVDDASGSYQEAVNAGTAHPVGTVVRGVIEVPKESQ